MLQPEETYPKDVQETLQEMGSSLTERGQIPAAIFSDPEIHRLELERVFARAWVFVGHESEIPSPGDYVVRYIGEDPFILVRDEEGRVRVHFDACRHRGTTVCRAEQGNASHFRCPYHGWTYKNTGELIGVPAFKEAYQGLDKSKWGLLQAPHVDSLHGLVFASLDPDAPPLDDYLGDMRWYLDLVFGLSGEGMEVVGEPHRWIIDSNWKSGAENFAGDDYHTLFLHKSMWEIGVFQIPAQANMFGYHVQAGNGHSASLSIAPNVDDPGPKFWGYPEEVVAPLTNDLTEQQRDMAHRARVTVGTVFPNLSFLVAPLSTDPKNKPPTAFTSIRQWQPKGPGKMEVWSWCLAWKGVPEEFRDATYKASMGSFSPSGVFEQDDSVPWESIARTAGTVFARKANMQLNYQMGMEGIGTAKPAPEWPGPGVAYAPRYEEGVHRSLYERWLQYMGKE